MKTASSIQKKHSGKTKSDAMRYCVIDSPVGELLLAGDETHLAILSFQDGKYPIQADASWVYDEGSFQETIQQLRAYFAGTLKKFTLKTAPQGTPFQLKVWQALRTIPYGQTVSYGEIAKAIGNPQASRAVGAANGQNPISIIVPCHRVIGSTGKLVGYGGGLPIKEALLMLEETNTAKKATPTNKRRT